MFLHKNTSKNPHFTLRFRVWKDGSRTDVRWIRKSIEILEVVALVDDWNVSDKDWDSKYCADIFLVVVATIWHHFLSM